MKYKILYIMRGISQKVAQVAAKLKAPLAIHCEAIHIDDVWKSCLQLASTRKCVWFVLTPINYNYVKLMFGAPPKRTYEKVLVSRYKKLIEMGQIIQLQVHLRRILRMSENKQRKMIVSSYNWLKRKIGVIPTEFVPGWWSYNNDTTKICKELSLRVVKFSDYFYIHDYGMIKGV
jgi:hypothetical protein